MVIWYWRCWKASKGIISTWGFYEVVFKSWSDMSGQVQHTYYESLRSLGKWSWVFFMKLLSEEALYWLACNIPLIIATGYWVMGVCFTYSLGQLNLGEDGDLIQVLTMTKNESSDSARAWQCWRFIFLSYSLVVFQHSRGLAATTAIFHIFFLVPTSPLSAGPPYVALADAELTV